jgi:trans-2,3-dihydro-3-hydroxyanthranilate isomerase
MNQVKPAFGGTFKSDCLQDMLNLPPEAFDNNFPIQEVSTGLPHIIVPLKSLEYLKRAIISKELYFKFIENTWAKNILVFCAQGYTDNHDISVRMFADYLGIPEDAATGSGNGCLAGYLVEHRYFNSDKIDVKVAQGYEINRPSLLLLRADKQENDIRISVGGKVIPVAEGKWE